MTLREACQLELAIQLPFSQKAKFAFQLSSVANTYFSTSLKAGSKACLETMLQMFSPAIDQFNPN